MTSIYQIFHYNSTYILRQWDRIYQFLQAFSYIIYNKKQYRYADFFHWTQKIKASPFGNEHWKRVPFFQKKGKAFLHFLKITYYIKKGMLFGLSHSEKRVKKVNLLQFPVCDFTWKNFVILNRKQNLSEYLPNVPKCGLNTRHDNREVTHIHLFIWHKRKLYALRNAPPVQSTHTGQWLSTLFHANCSAAQVYVL